MKKFFTTMLLCIHFLLFPFPAISVAAEAQANQATAEAQTVRRTSLNAAKATIAQPTTASISDSAATYACILTSDVYFHQAETDASALFTLPKTYFVKVLAVGTPYTKVEYQTEAKHVKPLIGYCLTSQLTFVDYIPVNPYLYATFEVKYAAENAEQGDAFLEKLTFTCGYYGDYTMGTKTYAYVLRDGEYAYVPKPTDFRYAENPEYADRLSTEADASLSASSATPIQMGLLVVLCLLVPLLSALIIKSSKSPYFDPEED